MPLYTWTLGSALGLWTLPIRKDKQWSKLAATEMRVCRCFALKMEQVSVKSDVSVEQTVYD